MTNPSKSPNQPFRELLNSAVYLACATVFISIVGLLYQIGYYGYFGINPLIAGIEIDVLSMTNGSMVPVTIAALSVVLLGVILLYRKAHERDHLLANFVLRTIVVVVGIIAITATLVYRQVEWPTAISVLASLGAIGVTIVTSFRTLVKHRRMQPSIDEFERLIQADTKKSKWTLRPALFMAIIIASTVLMSLGTVKEIGNSNARSQREFTSIASTSGSEIVEVVIARGKSGLIVKRFNTGIDVWEQGYYILSEEKRIFVIRQLY